MSIYSGLPENLRDALKRCDELVDDKQLDYLYDLYDPETGGFYFSISSRDAEEMTPFGEGTNDCHGILCAGGMVFPDWYKEKIGSWVREHQDESDGFFYEPLWGKITSGPRLHRDLTANVAILNRCGMQPKYPLPIERLEKNEKVETIPEYLSSEKALIDYMDSLDWSSKSIWATGQRLTVEVPIMKANGIFETAHRYVIEKQNKETGLWAEGLGWMNTNGSMKLTGFFTDAEHPYPNIEKMLGSVLELFKTGIAPQAPTWIWNPFVLIARAMETCSAENAEKYRTMLYDSGADIVNYAIDCAQKFRRADGGFASTGSRAIFRAQGYLFGYGLANESDTDGTMIAGHLMRLMIHKAFGITPPAVHYKDKADAFFERLKSKSPIRKILPRPEGPLTPKA